MIRAFLTWTSVVMLATTAIDNAAVAGHSQRDTASKAAQALVVLSSPGQAEIATPAFTR